MKASEVIQKIQELVKIYGDCEVIMNGEYAINLVRMKTETEKANHNGTREIVLL